jgi:2',3'-cyclic-nucleotide 2'-phosphodiesterase (5'-nucleotidase family)
MMSAALVACDGDDGRNGTNGSDGSNGLNSLVNQVQLAAGDSNCHFGGLRVDSGLDDNSNGTLEDGEVDQSNYICEDSAFQMQLLHFADVDGGRDIINNAKRFSAILNKFRGEHANTLVLSSGDNWIPGPDYNVASDASMAGVVGVPADGRAHVAYLNALGVQASAFGNHEFDLGTDDIAELLLPETVGSDTWPGAAFPYLSANLDFGPDANLNPLIGTDGEDFRSLANKVAASTVITVGGERVGVVGATTPTLNNISSPGDVAITPADSSDMAALAAAIQADVDALTAKGINKIILLAHMQQISIERQLAPMLRDVDIIVAGGSNTILADANDRLRDGDTAADEYPLQLQSASEEPVLIVNTDGDYTYLGRLVVDFDGNGLIATAMLNDEVNGAYATDDNGLTENGLGMTDAIAEVTAISDALTSALTARAGNVFGSTSVYLNGERGSVRTEETNLGNLTADANLAYAQANDATVAVSLKNGGGIRAAIGSCVVPPGATGPDAEVCSAPAGTPGINRPGEVSQLDLEIALRFNNSLTMMDLTGAELKQILEHAVAASDGSSTPGRFPQVAGIRFSYDISETAQTVNDSVSPPVVTGVGSRIRNLVVLDDNGAQAGGNKVTVVQNGVLDGTAATQVFRIVTLGFLAGGGDSFPFPANNVVDLEEAGVQSGNVTFADNGTEQDALAEYLFSNFPADTDEATPSFDAADVDAADDTRIQNLDEVATDTVLN